MLAPTVAHIVALKQQGYRDSEIAQEVGVPMRELQRLRRAGVIPQVQKGGGRHAPAPRRDDDIGRQLVAFKHQGLTDAEIAERMGIALGTVRKYRTQRGIPAAFTHDTHFSEWSVDAGLRKPPRPVTVDLFCVECGERYRSSYPPAVAERVERGWAKVHDAEGGCRRVGREGNR